MHRLFLSKKAQHATH